MKKINETFLCLWCKKNVPLAQKTCRNHCPFCFTSQHVDWDIPGDRAAIETCWGAMYPTIYELKNGMIKILFICSKCGKTHWNKASTDDEIGELDAYIQKYKWLIAKYL